MELAGEGNIPQGDALEKLKAGFRTTEITRPPVAVAESKDSVSASASIPDAPGAPSMPPPPPSGPINLGVASKGGMAGGMLAALNSKSPLAGLKKSKHKMKDASGPIIKKEAKDGEPTLGSAAAADPNNFAAQALAQKKRMAEKRAQGLTARPAEKAREKTADELKADAAAAELAVKLSKGAAGRNIDPIGSAAVVAPKADSAEPKLAVALKPAAVSTPKREEAPKADANASPFGARVSRGQSVAAAPSPAKAASQPAVAAVSAPEDDEEAALLRQLEAARKRKADAAASTKPTASGIAQHARTGSAVVGAGAAQEKAQQKQQPSPAKATTPAAAPAKHVAAPKKA